MDLVPRESVNGRNKFAISKGAARPASPGAAALPTYCPYPGSPYSRALALNPTFAFLPFCCTCIVRGPISATFVDLGNRLVHCESFILPPHPRLRSTPKARSGAFVLWSMASFSHLLTAHEATQPGLVTTAVVERVVRNIGC